MLWVRDKRKQFSLEVQHVRYVLWEYGDHDHASVLGERNRFQNKASCFSFRQNKVCDC